MPAPAYIPPPRFVRLAEAHRPTVPLTIDGKPCTALEGDTLLVALMCNGRRARDSEFGDGPRAGFCLMGACQDCWVRLADGRRVRACSTQLEDGQAISRDPGRQP